MGYGSSALQFRFPPYAFETSFPFFAMVWGYLGVKIYEGVRAAARAPSARRRKLARIVACGLLSTALFWPVRAEFKALTQRYRDLGAWWQNADEFYMNYPAIHFKTEHLRGKMQVIHELRREAAPGDGVFVWGSAPLIYFLTNRQPTTRFVSNLGLISPWGSPAWKEELVRVLKKSPPAFIVVAQRDQLPEVTFTSLDSEQYLSVYTQLGDFLSASYDFMGAFPDFLVYRRKPSGSIR
jgi:hypothetical protein